MRAETGAASGARPPREPGRGRDILKAFLIGGAVGAVGSAVGQTAEAGVKAVGGQSSAASVAGGAASATVDFSAGACGEDAVKC